MDANIITQAVQMHYPRCYVVTLSDGSVSTMSVADYNDAMMQAAHDEYQDWLTSIETFEDPDDMGPADGANLTAPEGLFTPAELAMIELEREYYGEMAALRADLYAF